MAKGKRTFVWLYSLVTGALLKVTNIQKKNFEAGEKAVKGKIYDKIAKKHVEFKIKEIKKG